MKNLCIVVALITSGLLSACTKSAVVDREFQLVEVLYDPGDGSGVFQPVESLKKIIFFDDDTFKVEHGDFCSFQEGPNLESTGTIDFVDSRFKFKQAKWLK